VVRRLALAAWLVAAAGGAPPAAAARAPTPPPVRFVDVARQAGLGLVNVSGAAAQRHIVETTGAGACFLDYDLDAAEQAFGDILRELRNQYVLGYYPSRNRDDGAWHQVTVTVGRRGNPVRTRAGYFDF
jgi:hypothetical protein